MNWGRIMSAVTASVAVAGCAVVAIGITRSHSSAAADRRVAPALPTQTARPAFIPAAPQTTPIAASTSATATTHPATASATASALAAPTTVAVTPSPIATAAALPATPSSRAPTPVHRTVHVRAATSEVTAKPTPRVRPKAVARAQIKPKPKGRALPVGGKTGSATRVITVDAHSFSSTTATLQEWNKAPGGGWLKRGTAVTAHVGSDGLTHHASESRSATPIGSFTLTRAFGHDSDPGTALPYVHTTPASWWISQAGKLYNTMQTCSSNCSFNQGSPNEHLYYETPFYNYAVVIDYNTRNAPGGVHQGKGSAFFLHVTDGNPTAGCVSIPQKRLLSVMRWLTPSAHPRILIDVT